MEDIITRYYVEQATTGQSGAGPVGYQRGRGGQRGGGVGSFLGGLFRRIIPILKKGTVTAGREVINSAANFINDVRHNVSADQALRTRAKEATLNVVKKVMQGDGYKKRSRPVKRQLTAVSSASNSAKKRKASTSPKKPPKKKSRDIFSK